MAGHWLAVVLKCGGELLRIEIHAVDLPELLLSGVESEIIFDAEAATKFPLRRLAVVSGVGQWRLVVGIALVKQAVQVCAERDVLQRGRRSLIPNRAVRQHRRIERQVHYAGILAVIAIHPHLESTFQVIGMDEFTRDRVRGALRRELPFNELEPVRLIPGLSVLGILALLARVHWAVGVGAELGFVLGLQE